MKKNYFKSIAIVIIAVLQFGALSLFGQAPEKMSYQAVIRNSLNNLVTNHAVGMRISILQGSGSGTAVYVESQTPTTNINGLVSIEVGAGTVLSGSFSEIDWSNGPYFIKTETDPAGGSTYTINGVSQLLSVPYALSSKNLVLPFSDSSSYSITPFKIENSGSAYYTISGLSHNGYGIFGKTNATNASGVLGTGTGSDYSSGVIGRSGELTSPVLPGNAGVIGMANANIGVAGSAISGIGGFFNSNSGKALKTSGGIQFTGLNEAAGRVLTCDINGNASWQNDTSGLILPYSKTVTCSIPAFEIINNNSTGIRGVCGSTSGIGEGVKGESAAANGKGVWGFASSVTGVNYGVYGLSSSTIGIGVYGIASDASGVNCGVFGTTNSESGIGVYGEGGSVGVKGVAYSGTNPGVSGEGYYLGVKGTTTASTGTAYAVYGRTTSSYGFAVYGESPYVGVYGYATNSSGWGGYFSGKVGISGNLGIGTAYPSYPLEVAGAANLNYNSTGVALRCNGAEAIWYNGTYYSWGYGGTYSYFGNKIFVGATAADPGTNLLVVNGAAAKPGGGSWATWSDKRLKDIQGNYEKGLNEIVLLQPVKYNYKKDNARKLPSDKNYTGFIAQDVQKVFPEAVNQEPDGFLTLDMNPVNVAMVNAIKELKTEIDKLKTSNDELKAKVEKLEKIINKK